ncbi:MAG: DUF2306 domain-containing protein [Calditrichaeota bacterium]|nr:DUF2306 domain-containing protein [Calditrichota bacterium]
METYIQILIMAHAGSGGLALLSGAVALTVAKGGALHKKSGKVFFYAMLTSAALALSLALMPNHYNPFLFSIGIFSAYFLISGFRSLRLKRKDPSLLIDRLISGIIIITGMGMILLPVFLTGRIKVVLTVFGTAGLVFGIRDLQLFKQPAHLRKSWLKLHLGKMTGGYISATTAFFVVNDILPGIWNWFLPGVIGSVFIARWIARVGDKR